MKYYSLLCIIAGVFPLAVIAVLSILDNNFFIFKDYISKLGIGEYAVLFNSTLVTAAILVVPFVFYVYKRYNYLIILFLATAASLAAVGLFPSSSGLHGHVSATFFLLAFASIMASGAKMRRKKSRWTSITLGIAGFIGLAFFNPFVETLLVYAVGFWVIGVGLGSKRLYEKG